MAEMISSYYAAAVNKFMSLIIMKYYNMYNFMSGI